VRHDVLLLGVDGGGTRCRARLADANGTILGEGAAGPANLHLGVKESFSAVLDATVECLRQADLAVRLERIVACLALAGATEPSVLAAAQAYPHPFCSAIIISDARAACIGAHGGKDGGIIIIGTGSVAWAISGVREHTVGGWGFPISDEGSGAWLGCETLRRVLWARDGLLQWTDMLRAVFEHFNSDPHAIVRWTRTARPRDFGSVVPIVIAYAEQGDVIALDLMRMAARRIDAMAARLQSLGVSRIALMGGLADKIEPFLSEQTRSSLVPPLGDALSGALRLAQAEAERLPTIRRAAPHG
jgi:glucosamine kinase